ncbi:MAG TPA: TonB C-terminal domain-containing protein, partial [Polyangiaceae bacterium]
MPRDSNIPLFLWVTTALLWHILGGGGAEQVAIVMEDRAHVQHFAETVRHEVSLAYAPFEVSIERPKPETELPKLEEPQQPSPPPATPEKPLLDKELMQRLEKEVALLKPHRDPSAPELVLLKKKAPEPKQPLPEADLHKRIAVRQHVEDENQPDNPNAEFIADHANQVKEQSVARVTSTDQDNLNPTPGGNFAGAARNPGDSDQSRLGQSEDRAGEHDRAPIPEKSSSERVARAKPTEPAQRAPGHLAPPQESTRTSAAQPGQEAQKPTPGSPEILDSAQGSLSFEQEAKEQAARRAQVARVRRLPPRHRPSPTDLLGLGAEGLTANGVNLNLTADTGVAAVGIDQLFRERKQDSERRRSQHRGSWQAPGLQRWRSAIENYVPSVKPGNQTALNTARVPFASYLNTIHNRLHPIFAESFLGSLDRLPGSDPMNRMDMSTNLEIVLSQDDGHVVRMGVTKTSGVTAFDISALESVQRAQPFGTPPKEIVSPDGRVYLHWEFWRDPWYACSTYFARPFLLKVQP